ncbi:MAG: alpha/beta hydrolase [Calditrichaeota bacterium]|nr:alpha/beta hydrolase [Calditrichota bacterium]
MLIKIIGGFILFYCIYAVFFFFFQRKLIYPVYYIQHVTEPQFHKFEKSRISFDENEVDAWFFPVSKSDTSKAPLIIIAHGNASLIDHWVDFLDRPNQMDVNVLLIEYPGYNRSTGYPTQQSITAVFVKAYDIFSKDKRVDRDKIIFLGRSLGGGVVCSLAKERKPAALILSSTFTSVRSFASQYFLPGFLARDPYDNLGFLENNKIPLMLVHGSRDRTIPIEHSEKLKAARPDAFFVTYESDHNNTPPDWNDFWYKVQKFLKQHRLLYNEVSS